jgi:hypothetical protein
MLSKVTQPRTGEFDYLVVELKLPSRKTDSDVLTQVEKYAMAVAKDPRFHGVQTKWTFIAKGGGKAIHGTTSGGHRLSPLCVLAQKVIPEGRDAISTKPNSSERRPGSLAG